MTIKISSVIFILLYFSIVCCEKLRVCVVDGSGAFKRVERYCPVLDNRVDSRVACVVGVDRLDCLRKISKGKADFSVFNAEDLVAAANSEIEVLITHELRFTEDKYDYEVVAVINNNSGITSKHDLRDKRFCHPGYGYEADWTKILSNYLEASVVPQSCDPQLSLTENRIKASSTFFKGACKAGPWDDDWFADSALKQKYPNLCKLCDNPRRCSKQDKYWGRRGSLFCLTDGGGDISWARLDDVKLHFGLTSGNAETTPDGYSLLCPDDKTMPINTTNPCVWVVKPWPVIATERTKAQDIRDIVTGLDDGDYQSWQSALRGVIETYQVTLFQLNPLESIEGYLNRAPGFLKANSFTGCHPTRTIRICTKSTIENAKCSWLRETAAVYGVEPDLDCLKADNVTHCMEAIANQVADLVMIEPDMAHIGMSKYNLTALFYETVNDYDKYLTVAVTKTDSTYNNLADLQGARACFPTFDGVAWNTVGHELSKNGLISCPLESAMGDFFGSSCVANLPPHAPNSLKEICDGKTFNGEYGAIICLLEGKGDVAFVNKNKLTNFFKDMNVNPYNKLKQTDVRIICDDYTKPCHLSWAPIGQAMIRSNASELWKQDTLNVFLHLDELFGKNRLPLTPPFTMFGAFDLKSNILFHDNTIKLRKVPNVREYDRMPRQYKNTLNDLMNKTCDSNFAVGMRPVATVFIFISTINILL